MPDGSYLSHTYPSDRVSSSRNRRNNRGVRRKMSGYPVRKASDKPLPTIDMATVVKILLPASPDQYKRAPRRKKPSLKSVETVLG
jgi:hypothetical protein